MRQLLIFITGLAASSVGAEIVLPAGPPLEPEHAYQHPALRSLVFVSPETRQMAILPPAPVFIVPPPLLWRAPTPIPPYPVVYYGQPGVNLLVRPNNRDITSYNLRRAHSFSQGTYYRDTYLSLGDSPYGYGWLAYGLAYPPAVPAGFNQSSHPSNRDNSAYNLERAHRFSMDAYRKP